MWQLQAKIVPCKSALIQAVGLHNIFVKNGRSQIFGQSKWHILKMACASQSAQGILYPIVSGDVTK